ncbi:MAG: HigA family addiction module antitoxin [Leptospiraceae bacterium]|nr:HigA family addiction module antitoxin [Leptospiraceae bacterium]
MKSSKGNHPGQILKKKFIDNMDISTYKLAQETLLSQTRISQIMNGKRAITAETALKLSRYFKTDPMYWLNLQSEFDLEEASKKFAKDLAKIKTSKK